MIAPRFIYFAPSDIQVARVARQSIVSFCSALQRLGVDVTLVAMGISVLDSEPRTPDPLDLYRIHTRFDTWIVPVPVSQTSRPRWLALNRLIVHALAGVRAIVTTEPERHLLLYTRTYSTALLLMTLGRLARAQAVVALEAHVLPRNAFQRFVLTNVGRVVANTAALKRDLLAEGYNNGNILAAHQGVDLELMDELRLTKSQARRRLNISSCKRFVVYTGKVVDGDREISYFLEAAHKLEARQDIHFVVVGGRADHVARLRAKSPPRNVSFVGFVEPRYVQLYQWAADVLVLYYPSGHPLNRYRSPGKLFEYMAAGRPIVCVDLPVLREVLGTPPAALLIPPDSPQSLADGVVRALSETTNSGALAIAALRRVSQFTWARRAEAFLRFVGA